MKETEKNEKKEYLIVYDFIMRMTDLTVSEKLVYALVYSFSADNVGELFASKKYIAERLGLSTSYVYRTLKSLIKKGLIYEKEVNNSKSYRVNLRAIKHENASPSEAIDSAMHNYVKHGKLGAVMLTNAQYYYLSSIVGVHALEGYIRVLENYFYDCPEAYQKNPNHYASLLRMINLDIE